MHKKTKAIKKTMVLNNAKLSEPKQVKLSEVINKSKQEDYLEVHFTERVLSCKDPEHHYYILTHCDETGEMDLYVDKEYNLKSVNWELRDEVCGEWVKEGAKYELMLTVYIGTELDAPERKKIFRDHVSTAVGLMMHGDAALIVANPTLCDSKVSICYYDGTEESSDMEELGLVRDHIYTSLKK